MTSRECYYCLHKYVVKCGRTDCRAPQVVAMKEGGTLPDDVYLDAYGWPSTLVMRTRRDACGPDGRWFEHKYEDERRPDDGGEEAADGGS